MDAVAARMIDSVKLALGDAMDDVELNLEQSATQRYLLGLLIDARNQLEAAVCRLESAPPAGRRPSQLPLWG
jgi:hypothetical protein